MRAAARWTAWSGLAFAVFTIAPPFLPSHAPDPGTAPAEELRDVLLDDYYLQHLQAFLHVAAAFALMLFAWALMTALDPGAPTARLALTGAAAAATTQFIGMSVVAAALTGVDVLAPASVEAAYNAGWFLFLRSGALLVLFLVPAGLLILRTRAAPVAFGWLAFVAAVPLALSAPLGVSEALSSVAAIGLVLCALWAAAVGLTMLAASRPPPGPGRPLSTPAIAPTIVRRRPSSPRTFRGPRRSRRLP